MFEETLGRRRFGSLTEEQARQFIARGHVVIRGAIPRERVEAWTAQVWTRLGYSEKDPATWAQSRIHMPSHNRLPVEELSPAAWAAICDLCGGAERVKRPSVWGDGFIVNLGAEDHADTWEPPSPEVRGWHKDGDWFKHFLDSPEQGLLTIVLWSDVVPRGGATFIAEDSVAPVARFLAAHPEGVLPGGFDFAGMIRECSRFAEATGEAGDVYLIHPYLLHASSKNALRRPRLITNPAVILEEPLRFDREDPDDFSLVELAVLNALGAERLEFRPTTARERVIPERERIQARMLAEEKARLSLQPG
jgi:hypothetical protein